jgi:hypothetical protein
VEVYRIDGEGYYIEPVILEESETIPVDCVGVKPPNFFKAKWDDGWNEGIDVYAFLRDKWIAKMIFESQIQTFFEEEFITKEEADMILATPQGLETPS